MKPLTLIVLINLISCALFADPDNPRATRGNITVISSEFGEYVDKKKYPVSNVMDEDPQTCWVFEKEASTFKKVVGLFFEFKSGTEIDGISLINGYAKSDSLYKFNNSISSFEIILPNHQTYRFSCTETTQFQDFTFPKQKVKWMIIKVIKERKGSKYNDLCISEISPSLDGEKLMYKQAPFIISNNGSEYENDFLINLQTQKGFYTGDFDFICGTLMPYIVNDSTLVYDDGCDENLRIEVFYWNKMTHKTVKHRPLPDFRLLDVLSETLFVIQDNKTEKIYQLNTVSNKLTPTKYTFKDEPGFWRWSERLDGDLSDYYKKIE